MLTRGDDYPLHQTAEPIAYAGTDRNFYDRYFFSGYPADADDDRMFALAFGVYPQLNIADASFCWMAGGRQINLHASRWLNMERMALVVWPISILVEEPLHACASASMPRITASRQTCFHRPVLSDRGAALHAPGRPPDAPGLYAADAERTL